MDYSKLLKLIGIETWEPTGKFLNENLVKYGVTDKENSYFFIANCANESRFKNYKEDLFYSTEVRLAEVYPKAFGNLIKDLSKFLSDKKTYLHYKDKSPCQIHNSKYNPEEYIKNPVKLANLVYNDNIFQKNLGNTVTPQDGSLFIGRGAVQTTGRFAYTKLSKRTGIDFVNNPQWLEKPEYALISALVYWQDNGINNKKTLLETRQIVAGNHTNTPFGLKEVQEWYNKIKSVEKLL